MEYNGGLLPTVYLSEGTVAADGSLILSASSRLPLEPGDKVSVIISRLPECEQENAFSLEGTVLRYDDPFGPATDMDDWDVLT